MRLTSNSYNLYMTAIFAWRIATWMPETKGPSGVLKKDRRIMRGCTLISIAIQSDHRMTTLPLMEWSGRALALPHMMLGRGCKLKEHRHAQQIKSDRCHDGHRHP